MKLLALALMLLPLGCGGSTNVTPSVPALVRTETAGQELLAKAPIGADLVLEVDLLRLRENPVLGPMLGGLAPPESMGSIDLLQKAESALLCVYDIGDDPKQLIVLKMSADPALFGEAQEIRPLGRGFWGVGDQELLRRAEAIAGGSSSMWDDISARRIREAAMPEKALNGALRMVARLDFDARVALASKVGVSEVPVTIAIWGDVVDDLALIIDLAPEKEESIPRLRKAVEGLRDRMAQHTYVRYVGLSPALRKTRIIRTAAGIRIVVVVAPQRLATFVKRVQRHLKFDNTNSPPTSETEKKTP